MYTSRDIALVIPTYNRPEILRRFLESLSNQTARPAEVVVVSAGQSVTQVIAAFSHNLEIVHAHVDIGGQVMQRNLGISVVPTERRLIACFDDDIVLLPDAIAEVLEFLNRTPSKYSGVAFNMINEVPFRRNQVTELLRLQPSSAGKVSRGGWNTSIAAPSEDLDCDWLPGGATIWNAEILRKFPNEPVKTRWAIGEDLKYSYSLPDSLRFGVASQAKVLHRHIGRALPPIRNLRRGVTFALWRNQFARTQPALSASICFYETFFRSLLGVATGMLRPANWSSSLPYSVGMFFGALASLGRSKSSSPYGS